MKPKLLNAVALILAAATTIRADVSEDVRELTGRPTRLVWARAVDRPDDFCAQGDRFRLLGLDTEDGRGIRPILGAISGYAKPILATGGTRVVYSNREENAVYVVNWDGSGHRKLVQGFASDVWTDPRTGVEWVLVRTGDGDQNNPIVRYRIDEPEVHEPVWTKTANGHNLVPWFRLSSDGTRAADAFPWSSCGVADLTKDRWQQYAGGCWPSIAPDDSYRTFVFQGNHRAVVMFDRDGTNRRVVAINDAPGIDGRDVYFPRWASEPRFLTMTGPGVGGRRRTCTSAGSTPASMASRNGSGSPTTTRGTSSATPGSRPAPPRPGPRPQRPRGRATVASRSPGRALARALSSSGRTARR